MHVWGKLLELLDAEMTRPTMFGWFHLLFFAASIVAGILLCVRFKEGTYRQARGVILTVAVLVTVLELYKQINYSLTYTGEAIIFDYQWYAFPWQFCSMPMYVGLLAGLTKPGKVHDSLCAFLATYAVFAGLCVMLYPVDVFTRTIGINIQTMICHGSMLTVGIYLLCTGYVKIRHETILKAIPVFGVALLVAVIMNEIAYGAGLLETDEFNMFFVSPHCEPSLPVYSSVQRAVAYPWCLFVYIAVFTFAAYVVLLLAMLVQKAAHGFSHKKRITMAIQTETKEPVLH